MTTRDIIQLNPTDKEPLALLSDHAQFPSVASNTPLLFDLSDPDLRAKLDRLETTPGYCILVDRVASTALKDQPPRAWLSRLHATFALVRTTLSAFQPLKMIGDALMYYIPESSPPETNALRLFLPMCYVAQEEDKEAFGGYKAAITYCQNVYEVSFLKGTRDYYGKDIDLTARLSSMAKEGEIFMNEPFVEQLRSNYRAPGRLKQDYPDVPSILGPFQEQIKGFTNPVSIYKLPAGGISLSKYPYPKGVFF